MIIDDLTRFYVDGGQKKFWDLFFPILQDLKHIPPFKEPYYMQHLPASMKFPLEFQQKIFIHRIFVAGVVFLAMPHDEAPLP